jgi:acetyl esterase/lipase
MMHVKSATIVVTALAASLAVISQTLATEPTITRDIAYTSSGDPAQRLDLHQPADRQSNAPLIIWVHGGAWRSGSKSDVPIAGLLKHGFVIASVDYRLTPQAPFPAQVHDIKAAMRFLRSRAVEYGVDAQRFFIAGSSAGGHLAALVGVSAGVSELEGSDQSNTSDSSSVAAIVSYYGASNLQTILDQSTPFGLTVRVPALQLLLGGQPNDHPNKAILASPIAHVEASDPPLFLIHGDHDPQMPIEQAYELQRAYRQAKLSVQMHIVPGGVHGGKGFYEPEVLAKVAQFLMSAATGCAMDRSASQVWRTESLASPKP